jgi:hypothetical protein
VTNGRFLLDEMVAPAIADGLRQRGHDAEAVVANPAHRRLPDEGILQLATAEHRILVTANIRDFLPLDRAWRAAGRTHAGLVLLPFSTFPPTVRFVGEVTTALDAVARRGQLPGPGTFGFLAHE